VDALQRRTSEVYVHYVDSVESRMNESASASGKQPESPARSPRPPVDVPSHRAEIPEETYAERNFDKVNFGQWHIKTWSVEGISSLDDFDMPIRYYSPYPPTESDADDTNASASQRASPFAQTGSSRVAAHGHQGRTQGLGLKPLLLVCDRCFKYMSDGRSWELHIVRFAAPVNSLLY